MNRIPSPVVSAKEAGRILRPERPLTEHAVRTRFSRHGGPDQQRGYLLHEVYASDPYRWWPIEDCPQDALPVMVLYGTCVPVDGVPDDARMFAARRLGPEFWIDCEGHAVPKDEIAKLSGWRHLADEEWADLNEAIPGTMPA